MLRFSKAEKNCIRREYKDIDICVSRSIDLKEIHENPIISFRFVCHIPIIGRDFVCSEK